MRNNDNRAWAIVQNMLDNDRFSQWLGLKLLNVDNGYCQLEVTITADMLNGFKSVQGGVLFSAADSAFAFACNTCGMVTVALDASISFALPAYEGDVLTVEAHVLHEGRKTAICEVRVYNTKAEVLAIFKGTAYKTGQAHV